MSRPARTYTDMKATARTRLLAYFADAGKTSHSISVAVARRFCHHCGLDAFLEPVLEDLEAEGHLSVWRNEGGGIIYIDPATLPKE